MNASLYCSSVRTRRKTGSSALFRQLFDMRSSSDIDDDDDDVILSALLKDDDDDDSPRSLPHDQLWAQSALVQAFTAALSEYKVSGRAGTMTALYCVLHPDAQSMLMYHRRLSQMLLQAFPRKSIEKHNW